MALFKWTRPRPNVNTSRQAWLDSWAHDFKRNYEPPTRIPEIGGFAGLISPHDARVMLEDDAILSLHRMEKELVEWQTQLIEALDGWTQFEKSWKTATYERRRDCAEEAIHRLGVIFPSMFIEMIAR